MANPYTDPSAPLPIEPRARWEAAHTRRQLEGAQRATDQANREAAALHGSLDVGDTGSPSTIDAGAVPRWEDPEVISGVAKTALDSDAEAAAAAERTRRAGPGEVQFGLASDVMNRSSQAELDYLSTAEAEANRGSRTVTVTDPTYKLRKERADTHEVANEAIVEGTEAAGAAQYARELAKAKALGIAYEEVAKRHEEERIKALERADKLQRDRYTAALETDKMVLDAAKALQAAPEEDPGKFWASRTAFQKVMLTLSAVAKGWLMGQGFNVDPMGAIKAGVREEIETQRSNRAKLGEKLTAAERASKSAWDVFAAVDEMVTDQDAREQMKYIIRMQTIEAELAKIQAEAGAEITGGEVDVLMGKIQKEIADEKLALQSNLMLHPERYSKTVRDRTVAMPGPDGRMYNMTPGAAAEYRKMKGARVGKLEDKGIDIAAAGAQAEGAETAAVAKEGRAAAAAKAAGPDTAQRRFEQVAAYRLAQDTVVDQGVVDQVVDLKNKWGDDVPGFGSVGFFGSYQMSDKQQAAYYDLVNVITRSIRPETGAAYSAQEIDNASGGIIIEGRTPEENGALRQAIGMLKGRDEDDVMHILDEIEKKHRRRIKHLQKAVPDDVKQGAGLDPSAGTTPRPIEQVDETDPVNWED